MKITQNAIFKKLMLLFGLFGAAPIITIFNISGYVFFLLIIGVLCVITTIKKRGYIVKFGDTSYIYLSFWIILSYAICYFRMENLWTSKLLTSFIQFVFLLIVYVCLESKKYIELKLAFIKGVYYSSIIQLIWTIIQFLCFNVGVDINTVIFKDLLHMVEIASAANGADWELSGLCWHPSNLAVLFVFGYLYTNNKILKVIYILVSCISGSRTLIAGIFFCIFISILIPWLKNKKAKKNTLTPLLIIMFCIPIGFVIFPNLFLKIFNKLIEMYDVINNFGVDSSTNAHIRYLLTIPEVTKRNDFISNIFGYGPGCSGYVFSHYYGQFVGIAWVIECDYVNILWSYGYVGFILYYIWYIKNIIKSCNLNVKYILFFLTLMVMGLMYNITYNWVQLLILMVFSLSRNRISIF